MKIPSRLKIKKGVTYEVVFIKDFPDNTVGECRFDKKQIVLSTDQSEKDLIKTFIHEVTHAITHERKIKISHKAVYQFENALLYFFKENGLLAKTKK